MADQPRCHACGRRAHRAGARYLVATGALPNGISGCRQRRGSEGISLSSSISPCCMLQRTRLAITKTPRRCLQEAFSFRSTRSSWVPIVGMYCAKPFIAAGTLQSRAKRKVLGCWHGTLRFDE